CVVKVKRHSLILLPHLPVSRAEVRKLVGFSIWSKWSPLGADITANSAVPAVGRNFDRTPEPQRFELASVALGHIFRAPKDMIVTKRRSELADFEESHLVAKRLGVYVLASRRAG